MTNIPFWIELLEKDSVIVNRINNALSDELNAKIRSRISNIESKVRTETLLFFQDTEIYNSLVYGNLAGHFGIPAQGRQGHIDSILQTICNNLVVEFKEIKYVGSKFTNGIKIDVLLRDLSDILSLGAATVVTEKGDFIDWLRWLLTAGDKIIVREFEVEFNTGMGRSGLAIMVAEDAGVWRVPPEYAGTLNNNWLTRALLNRSQMYLDKLQKILEDELGTI